MFGKGGRRRDATSRAERTASRQLAEQLRETAGWTRNTPCIYTLDINASMFSSFLPAFVFHSLSLSLSLWNQSKIDRRREDKGLQFGRTRSGLAGGEDRRLLECRIIIERRAMDCAYVYVCTRTRERSFLEIIRGTGSDRTEWTERCA